MAQAQVTEYPIPTASAGADMWFTDPQVNSIGRSPAGPLPPADSVSGAFTTAPQCGLRCSPPEYDLDVSSGPGGEAPKGEITFRKGNPGGRRWRRHPAGHGR